MLIEQTELPLIIPIMNDESFKDLRRTDNKAGTSEEMLRRSVHLTDLGFSPEFVADFMGDKSHLEHNIDAKLSNLKIAGFENPVALVEKNPQILNLSFEENIKAKLENLKKAGFENPVKLVEKFPTILNYSFEENIKPKLVDLENAGFSN
ncbi:MAG: hypothetical protein ABI430_02670, partial [Candidatus Taylorbacteria bacterium]